jgi:16S rRNA (uracil1498-N3)-methyltransferase
VTAPAERAAFFSEEPFAVGAEIALSDSETRHIAVLRLGPGERVGLRNGAGGVASGVLVRIAKKYAIVELDAVDEVAPPPPVHLLLPVADRDRMLWMAEKAAELNVATWRPVLWHRSRSVAPRGDGPTFRAKVRARMIAALLQSRSAWLPAIHPEATPERAIAAAPSGLRLVAEWGGEPIAAAATSAPVSIAIGPEGGFEERELALLRGGGFRAVSLGDSILRFETAAVAAVAVARAMLAVTATPACAGTTPHPRS